MKLTNEKIITFMSIDLTAKKLPIKLGYAYSVNRSACEVLKNEYETRYNETIRKYAERDEEGNMIPPDEQGIIHISDMAAFTEEMNELATMEIEVPITTVSVDVLEKCDEEMFDSLSVAEISSIAFMIED